MLFGLESVIKGLAFDSDTILFEIAPKLCLWAIGIIFGIIVSSKQVIRGQERILTKDTIIYTFIYSICAWVATVVLSNKSIIIFHQSGLWTPSIYYMLNGSLILAGGAIGSVLLIAREVEKQCLN